MRGVTYLYRFSVITVMLISLIAPIIKAECRSTIGAIRWDAWTGGSATRQVERTLGPAKYHHRLPWFAEVINDNSVRIDGSRQEVMDQEIQYAADAGLDYWAFVTYEEDSEMSVALKQYLKSQYRHRINFCLILHHFLNMPSSLWQRELERMLRMMQEPSYQRVCSNQPLIYNFTAGDFQKKRFREFLDAATAKNMNPYCVFMGWHPASDYRTMHNHGFDAVSAYAIGGSQATFAELVSTLENSGWQGAVNEQIPYIPLVTTGWDKNPRKDNPVSWELNDSYHQQARFPALPTSDEIATHLRRAIAFVHNNRNICPANTIITYAWNEYDEGGWLAPTRGRDGKPDTSRIEALKQVLGRP